MTPGLTCGRCERPFRGHLARRTPDGFTHAGKCPLPPRAPCRQCSRPTRSTSRLCAICLDTSPTVLQGGRWVLDPVRRIQRWEAA